MDFSNCAYCGTANFRDCKHRPAFAPVPANLREGEKVDKRKDKTNHISPGLAFNPNARKALADAAKAFRK